ncbi:DUF669 domain-containing protein [Bacillus toyonensis]|uniref:DUF669 domain-containing protein n=1 Tax=Bacillus toyonensis TaxID=155322 RepID=UPI00027BEAAA|nr:DUF669 domain-containing protein [Bacillus toyonensis]EJV41778.1 single-stranded DNA-binding protein ssb [Bacillus toyonensis]
MSFSFKFDSSNTGNNEFAPIPEGKYELRITKAEANEYMGNWSIKYDVEIRGDVQQECKGRNILYNTLYLSSSNPEYAEKTQQKINAFLTACGFSGQQDLNLDQVVKQIVGKNVLGYTRNEEKNGKTFSKVVFVANSQLDKQVPPVQQTQQTNNDPFANNTGKPINISDDDLPF